MLDSKEEKELINELYNDLYTKGNPGKYFWDFLINKWDEKIFCCINISF